MRFIISLFLILSILLPFGQSGKAVIAGGDTSSSNTAVFQAFVDLATPSKGSAYIGVITAGNTDMTSAQSTANTIISRLKKTYGVAKVEWLPFHISNGNICKGTTLNSKLKSMTGLYFNGGTTGLITGCFNKNGGGSPALSIIQSRFKSNDLAIFASSAAALSLQSTPVIVDTASYNVLVSGAKIDPNGGFGLFPYGFIDVHFRERGNQGRLIRLVSDRKASSNYGFGIDQDTAMVLQGSKFSVVGYYGVSIIDVSGATRNTRNGRWAAQNVKLSYLTKGDSYNLSTKTVSYASFKKSQTSNTAITTTSNIFGPAIFTTVSLNLARSNRGTATYGLTTQTKPRYRVNFRKTLAGVTGTSGGTTFTSFRNMYLDVYCSSNC